jgi:hypothetical protein
MDKPYLEIDIGVFGRMEHCGALSGHICVEDVLFTVIIGFAKRSEYKRSEYKRSEYKQSRLYANKNT